MDRQENEPICFYEVLGLDRRCSGEEIRRAYRRLAVLHHPDKNIGNEEDSAHMFKLIAEVRGHAIGLIGPTKLHITNFASRSQTQTQSAHAGLRGAQ